MVAKDPEINFKGHYIMPHEGDRAGDILPIEDMSGLVESSDEPVAEAPKDVEAEEPEEDTPPSNPEDIARIKEIGGLAYARELMDKARGGVTPEVRSAREITDRRIIQPRYKK